MTIVLDCLLLPPQDLFTVKCCHIHQPLPDHHTPTSASYPPSSPTSRLQSPLSTLLPPAAADIVAFIGKINEHFDQDQLNQDGCLLAALGVVNATLSNRFPCNRDPFSPLVLPTAHPTSFSSFSNSSSTSPLLVLDSAAKLSNVSLPPQGTQTESVVAAPVVLGHHIIMVTGIVPNTDINKTTLRKYPNTARAWKIKWDALFIKPRHAAIEKVLANLANLARTYTVLHTIAFNALPSPRVMAAIHDPVDTSSPTVQRPDGKTATDPPIDLSKALLSFVVMKVNVTSNEQAHLDVMLNKDIMNMATSLLCFAITSTPDAANTISLVPVLRLHTCSFRAPAVACASSN
eukprot:jgi/Psemu1/31189/gm1.31189_g